MRRKICYSMLIASLVAGCADLRGIPQGLTAENTKALSDPVLENVLETGDTLSGTYKSARNDNLDYTFWSTTPYIPAAAGAAGTIYYKGSLDILAGIGIFVGTLTGVNTLVNAKANAGAYQSGVTALACLRTTLTIFTTANRATAITQTLGGYVNALDTQLATAQADLSSAKSFDFTTAQARAEVTANPSVVSDFATAQKNLNDAITAAISASNTGHAETDAFNTLSQFAGSTILSIDQLVSAKVTQGSVDFATLRNQITSAINEDVAAKAKAAAATQAVPPTRPPQQPLAVPSGPSTTPIANQITQMAGATNALTAASLAVTNEVKITGVVSAETAATACTQKI